MKWRIHELTVTDHCVRVTRRLNVSTMMFMAMKILVGLGYGPYSNGGGSADPLLSLSLLRVATMF